VTFLSFLREAAMRKVQHMVMVKFKPVGAGKVGPLFAALGQLSRTIPGILHFSGGPYASPEGLNQGFTHGFLFTFESAKARDAYLVHPDHQKVVAEFLPILENVLAFDFEE
jgi:hypothetical protein